MRYLCWLRRRLLNVLFVCFRRLLPRRLDIILDLKSELALSRPQPDQVGDRMRHQYISYFPPVFSGKRGLAGRLYRRR